MRLCKAWDRICSVDQLFKDVLSARSDRQTERVVSALQPTWLIGLGRARTRDQPVSRRNGYPDRFLTHAKLAGLPWQPVAPMDLTGKSV